MKNLTFDTKIEIFIREIESGKGDWATLPLYEDELVDLGIREGKEWEIVDFDNYTGIDIDHLTSAYYPSLQACNEFKDMIDKADRDGQLTDLGLLINELGHDEGIETFERENYYITYFTPYSTTDLSYAIMENLDIPEEWKDYIDDDKIIRDYGGESVNMKEGYMITRVW